MESVRGLQEGRPHCGHKHPRRGGGLPYSPEADVSLLRLVPLSFAASAGMLLHSWLHGLLLCTHTAAGLCVPVVGQWLDIPFPEILSSVFQSASAVFKLIRPPTSRMKVHGNVNLDPTQVCQTVCNEDLSLTHGCKRTSVQNFTCPVERLCAQHGSGLHSRFLHEAN